MPKEQTKAKVATKVSSFEEVQRSLQEVEKRINDLSNSINKVAEDYVKETEGKSGDLKLTKKANRTYNLEARTKDGWKKFYSSNISTSDGLSEVYLSDKPRIEKIVATDRRTPDEDSRYELSGQITLRALLKTPDYDSGWVNAPSESAGATLTHGLSGVDPNDGKVLDYVVYFRNGQDNNADRWIKWASNSTDSNDHFSFAFNATQFLYHQDSDSSNTRVKWGVNETTEETTFENISFRIFAWKLF